MARHLAPVAVPKNIEKWLYDALTRLQDAAEQSSASTAAIVRGEVPDGSGNPLTPDLSQYFYLPGRQGGQLAFFDTAAGGIGQLSSTSHDTKGIIYFGEARTSVYDEANDRFGAGTASPDASVHAVGVAGGVAYSASALSNSNWGLYAGASGGDPAPANVHVALTSPSDDYIGYIGRNGDNNGVTANCVVALNTSPGSGTSFIVNFRASRLFGTIPSGTSLIFTVRNSAGVEYLGSFDPSVLTTSWVDYQITCDTVGATGQTADSLKVTAVFQSSTGSSGYLIITYAEVLVGSGTSTGSILAQAASGQSAHLYDAQNAAGTSLVNVTASGRLTVESGG